MLHLLALLLLLSTARGDTDWQTRSYAPRVILPEQKLSDTGGPSCHYGVLPGRWVPPVVNDSIWPVWQTFDTSCAVDDLAAPLIEQSQEAADGQHSEARARAGILFLGDSNDRNLIQQLCHKAGVPEDEFDIHVDVPEGYTGQCEG